MSLRGLDDFITGHDGDDYWKNEEPEDEHDFVCGFCRSGACSMCLGKRCDCPGRYGKTAPTHGPYQGPVKLVQDNEESQSSALADGRLWNGHPNLLVRTTAQKSGLSISADGLAGSLIEEITMAQPQTRPASVSPQAPGLQIRKAERKQAKLRLALSGPSGSGKTYSALLIAFGLGGKRIGMIDTERGSGELYSHIGDYDIIALDPPYTVSRYLEAMNMFEVAGYDTIIIDSITHEWAGEGGLLRAKEQIDAKAGAAGDKYNPFASWAKITPHHDRFIAAMLGSPCHLIATMRSKMTYVQEGSSIKKRGVEPVQRDQIEYEFTVVLDINAEHIAVASKDRTELFGGWMEQITPRVGERLLNWLNNAPASTSTIPDVSMTPDGRRYAAGNESQPHSESQQEPRAIAPNPHGSATSAEHFVEMMPGVEVSVSGEAEGESGVREPAGREALDAPADDPTLTEAQAKTLADLVKATHPKALSAIRSKWRGDFQSMRQVRLSEVPEFCQALGIEEPL